MARKTIAVLSCIAFLTVAALRAERLPLRRFSIADGLPHDVVSQIFCDSRGLLWFATREGLARFDGDRFTLLNNVPLLAGARVRDIIEKPRGTYWIATNRGLIRFKPGDEVEFQRVDVPLNAYAVAAARDNGVWVAVGHSVFHVGADRIASVEHPEIWVRVLFESENGLWMGTDSGLFRRGADGTLTRYSVRDGLSGDDIRTIAVDRQGFTWIGTTSGLCRFRASPASGVDRFNVADGLPAQWVNAILPLRNGTIWVATTGGLARSELANASHLMFRPYTSSNGFTDKNVFTLAEDHDGDIWAGTESSGVYEIVRSGFISFAEDDGLKNSRIAAIGEDRHGDLFVVSSSDVLHTFDGRQFHAWQPRFPQSLDYFGWGWNQVVLQANDGEWWIATGRGLWRFPAVRSIADLTHVNAVAVYTTAAGMPHNDVFRVFEDSHGDIWASVINDRSPLVRIDHDKRIVHAYGVSDGMPGDQAPMMFAEDRAGNLWIGFFKGRMLRHRHGRFENIVNMPPGGIRDMRFDHAGRLWVATEIGGAACIDDPTADKPVVRVYTKEQGLSTNEILSIVEDRFGRIYLGTSHGINRLEPDSGRVKRFTTADGLPNNVINVAFADHTGALWFGTLQGIARLVPERDETRPPPAVWISGLRVAGVPRSISAIGTRSVGPFDLEPDQNRVDIDFESVTFRPAEALRYQYRLARDGNWSIPVEQRSVALANLAPGKYLFQVRAISSDGIVSALPAVIRFSVLPPVWHRWWFMVGVAVAMAAMIHLYYRARARRLLEMERVRVRIASDLHDDIGASLSRIVVLSEVVKRQVDDPRSGRMLADIAESARSVVESMSDIVWSIDPRHDDVESLNRRLRQCAVEILDSAGIRWTFESDSHADRLKLGPAQRRHIYLVVKEALTNAVRHAGCHDVSITLSAAEQALQIQICDDGNGFDPDRIGDGHGLRNIRTRLTDLGGDVKIDTSVGGGTRLKVRLPLRQTA
ncbi:MAG TPA: two-component regulator propeller domain-containing protein [Thermoanaerobaculia bacterium]|nr:two-component regulator propeller domain-containing protein [Thermoanaerobaculia bacterium]